MKSVNFEISKKNTLYYSGIMMCILGIAFFYYEYYLRVTPSVLREELKNTFHLTDAGFGSLTAYYFYAYTPLQLPVGILIDRYGIRIILTLSCFICALSICLFSLSADIFLAKISWFLLGFGSAFAYVGVLKITDAELPSKYFSLVAGICSAFGMFGGISGELMMTQCIHEFGWHNTLYYSGIIGFILAFSLWMVLRDKDKSLERGTPQQKISLSQLKTILLSKTMWVNGLIGCLTFLPISIFAGIWAVPYLETIGFNKNDAAMGSSMVFLGFAIGGPLFGILSTKLQSHRQLLITGSFVAALLMAIVIWNPIDNISMMFLLLFLSGLFASAQIMVFSVSNNLSDATISATALAFTNMIVMLGGVLLPQIMGLLLDNSTGLKQPQSQDFMIALSILPLGLFVAGLLSIGLQETYRED